MGLRLFFLQPTGLRHGIYQAISMGIRYNPDDIRMKEEIWGSTMYSWTSQEFVHQSFYIEKDGVETVVNTVMDTGVLQLAAVWKLVRFRSELQLTISCNVR